MNTSPNQPSGSTHTTEWLDSIFRKAWPDVDNLEEWEELREARAAILENLNRQIEQARIEGALFALDNETYWQYQRKCSAGEASKITKRWWQKTIEDNIAKYKATKKGM